jgi:hypothetical protein
LTLDIVFSAGVAFFVAVVVFLKLVGVIPEPEKVIRRGAFFILAGGCVVDLVNLARHPSARTDVRHLLLVACETLVISALAYHEIKTYLHRPRVTNG